MDLEVLEKAIEGEKLADSVSVAVENAITSLGQVNILVQQFRQTGQIDDEPLKLVGEILDGLSASATEVEALKANFLLAVENQKEFQDFAEQNPKEIEILRRLLVEKIIE